MIRFDVGNSTVTLEHEGRDYSPEDSGFRQRYRYTIAADGWKYIDNDIRSGCGAAVDEPDMARALFSFLAACAESRSHGGGENADLFPGHIGQWAEENSDALSLLSIDEEDLA